jgi:hypothetical protein
METARNECNIWVGKPVGKKHRGKPRYWCKIIVDI